MHYCCKLQPGTVIWLTGSFWDGSDCVCNPNHQPWTLKMLRISLAWSSAWVTRVVACFNSFRRTWVARVAWIRCISNAVFKSFLRRTWVARVTGCMGDLSAADSRDWHCQRKRNRVKSGTIFFHDCGGHYKYFRKFSISKRSVTTLRLFWRVTLLKHFTVTLFGHSVFTQVPPER